MSECETDPEPDEIQQEQTEVEHEAPASINADQMATRDPDRTGTLL